MTTITCKICGKEEELDHWCEDEQKQLKKHQMCFKCNHWRMNHELDMKKRGDHCWAIINGHHYVFGPNGEKDNWMKGFGGSRFKIKFKEGTIKETDNLWHQGDIKEAHQHWREVMPDNAEFVKDKGYFWYGD